eukprot:c27373_g1_i1 orf=151-423(-)
MLHRLRWRGGELRILLEKSPTNKEILSNAQGHDGKALQIEMENVNGVIEKLKVAAKQAVSNADLQEAAMMRAVVAWDVLNEYISGKVHQL